MFGKLLIVMICVVLMGGALLGLRVQRQHLHHQITRLHVQVDQARHRTWDAQVRIAERAAPAALRSAAERVGIELEPAVPHELREEPRDRKRLVEAHRAAHRP